MNNQSDPIDRPTDIDHLREWLAANGDIALRPEGDAAGEPDSTLGTVLSRLIPKNETPQHTETSCGEDIGRAVR